MPQDLGLGSPLDRVPAMVAVTGRTPQVVASDAVPA